MDLNHTLRRAHWLALITALALGVVACDGDGDDTDAGPIVDTDAGTDETDAGGTPSNTIADIDVAGEDFTILEAAVVRAGLDGLLASETDPAPFTVFAPSDDAFAASGITLAMVEAMPTDQLTGILTYHAIPTVALPSTSLPAGPVTTAAELSLIIGTDGGVTLNGGNAVTGGANVVTADIEADNGVIHVIDRVLLPPTVADLTRYAGLSELGGAVEAAGLTETLSGEGPFTVFAPTDAAFEALSAVPTGEALTEVLLYHVVSGRVFSTGIPANAPSLATREYTMGATTREVSLSLLFDTSDGVAINGGSEGAGAFGAAVVIADVRATNGVVHVVDAVLTPLSIAQIAIAGGFDSLVGAVTASADIPAALVPGDAAVPVIDALSEDTLAPLTVFAPTDAAFGAITVPTDPGDILGVLALHVIAMELPVRAEDLPTDTTTAVPPLSGSDLTFDASADPPTVTVTGGTTAGIVAADLGATNGIVHAVDAVLLEGT